MLIPPGMLNTPFEAKDRGEYVREPLMDITLTEKDPSTAQLLEIWVCSCNFGRFGGHLFTGGLATNERVARTISFRQTEVSHQLRQSIISRLSYTRTFCYDRLSASL
jgi:hypothetical protein